MERWWKTKDRARLHAKKKKRIGLLVLAVVTMGCLVATGSVMGAMETPAHVEVVVQPGDTLWNIAAENTEGRDVRRVVWEIRQLNDLDDVSIHPGQVLLIPQG